MHHSYVATASPTTGSAVLGSDRHYFSGLMIAEPYELARSCAEDVAATLSKAAGLSALRRLR
jgi:hypothetical protein